MQNPNKSGNTIQESVGSFASTVKVKSLRCPPSAARRAAAAEGRRRLQQTASDPFPPWESGVDLSLFCSTSGTTTQCNLPQQLRNTHLVHVLQVLLFVWAPGSLMYTEETDWAYSATSQRVYVD